MPSKNLTLKIDEAIFRKCQFEAVKEDKSLSKWVTELLVNHFRKNRQYNRAKKRALYRLENGLDLKGSPLKREELYNR